MKKRPNTLLLAGLLVLVVLTVAATAQAQAYARGSFTLPYEVEWRGETVPEGHYTFEIQHAIPHPIVTIRNMEYAREIRLIGSAAAVSEAPLRNSALEIVTVDGKHYIHTFDISAISASFIYKTPKLPPERFPNANEVSRITVPGAPRTVKEAVTIRRGSK
jgi:hypothetical protein